MLEPDRFWSQTEQKEGCLIWKGAVNENPVYGIFMALGGRLIAHRVAYELAFGPLPSHAHVGRMCHNDLCVAPLHLFLQNASKSLNPIVDEKKKVISQVDILENGCWQWKGKVPKCIALASGIKTLARGIYELYYEPIPRSKEVYRNCMKDDCFNPEHFELVDKAKLGKSNSKLNYEQVLEIRKLAHTGEYGLMELAAKFNTSRQTIYTVVYNLGWHDPAYIPPEKMPRKSRFCRKGHLFDVENTIVLESGARKCKICQEIALANKKPRKTLTERFWEKVKKTDGCWEWTAYSYNDWGYFSVNRVPQLAHRVAYELTYGEIPPGVKVLHDCKNDGCVRPDHLYLEGKMAAK